MIALEYNGKTMYGVMTKGTFTGAPTLKDYIMQENDGTLTTLTLSPGSSYSTRGLTPKEDIELARMGAIMVEIKKRALNTLENQYFQQSL